MSILSDKDIAYRMAGRGLVIEPLDMSIDPIQPASVDLRLGDVLTQSVTWDDGDPLFTVEPGAFVLASTLETVRIPDDLVARVEGKSTFGRLGLMVHITAGFIDPGFHGQITLELYNCSREAVILRPGQKVCQLSLQTLTRACERPYGHPTRTSKYQNQRGPTESR